jgi:dihydrofolate synthase / folylpolyglutamate synthase
LALYFCTMLISSYQQAVEYLYQNLPIFQRVGAVAYKADLTNTIKLCEAIGNPQHQFKSIHVAGTNGKGSSSHMLAAVMQSADYKTGLYTSPHLKNFTERIKVNGQDVEQDFVVDFVNRIQPSIEEIQPSFFEITVAMAFDYFAQQKVDVAVIEVGLGGRLDSTNVITPLVSLITNISWDHMDLLGDTLPKIAMEKAGIIKDNIPVVISERQSEVEEVFCSRSSDTKSQLTFAEDIYKITDLGNGMFEANSNHRVEQFLLDLKGRYQRKNLAGVLATINHLKELGFKISTEAIQQGLSNTTSLTGLKGRWQKLGENPTVICDTGHNEAGVQEVLKQINQYSFDKLHMVWGMVKDKDISKILKLLPINAQYYFCQANIPRAMEAMELAAQAKVYGLEGKVIPDVNSAIEQAQKSATPNDFIFIGGSTFVVAEVDDL